MSSNQDRIQSLSEHKVVPDVLPGSLDLSYDLALKWPNTTLNTPAQELDREETQPEPRVYLYPPPSETLDNLVLIMTDPDLMMNDDTYFGQVRHWLVTNLSTNSDGFISIPQESQQISPYIGPAPLPNYLYPRPHRYVFILARGTGKVEITSEDLRELQKPYAAAMAGNQEVQDLKDRWGFNAQKLIEKKGLKVEAVNFMRVGGTLKSAAANMVMMGQAMANKVIGK